MYVKTLHRVAADMSLTLRRQSKDMLPICLAHPDYFRGGARVLFACRFNRSALDTMHRLALKAAAGAMSTPPEEERGGKCTRAGGIKRQGGAQGHPHGGESQTRDTR